MVDAPGKSRSRAKNEDEVADISTKKGTSSQKNGTLNSADGHKRFNFLNVTPNSQVRKRFDGVAYGSSKKKEGVKEMVEEFAFAVQAVHFSDKEAGEENKEKRVNQNNESFQQRLSESLETAASQKEQDSDSTAFEEGTENPKLIKQCNHTSNKAARPKQNSESTETDSESPIIRSVTRSLTRKKASTTPNPKLRESKSNGRNFSSSSHHHQPGNLYWTANPSLPRKTEKSNRKVDPQRLSSSGKKKPDKIKQGTGRGHGVLGTNMTPSHSSRVEKSRSDPSENNKEHLQSKNGKEEHGHSRSKKEKQGLLPGGYRTDIEANLPILGKWRMPRWRTIQQLHKTRYILSVDVGSLCHGLVLFDWTSGVAFELDHIMKPSTQKTSTQKTSTLKAFEVGATHGESEVRDTILSYINQFNIKLIVVGCLSQKKEACQRAYNFLEDLNVFDGLKGKITYFQFEDFTTQISKTEFAAKGKRDEDVTSASLIAFLFHMETMPKFVIHSALQRQLPPAIQALLLEEEMMKERVAALSEFRGSAFSFPLPTEWMAKHLDRGPVFRVHCKLRRGGVLPVSSPYPPSRLIRRLSIPAHKGATGFSLTNVARCFYSIILKKMKLL